MQEFLVTIIVAWILFRLFRPVIFVQSNQPQKHYHNYYPGGSTGQADGEIKVTRKPSEDKSNGSGDNGEYVDFEELPKP